jgi:uncharacterized protein
MTVPSAFPPDSNGLMSRVSLGGLNSQAPLENLLEPQPTAIGKASQAEQAVHAPARARRIRAQLPSGMPRPFNAFEQLLALYEENYTLLNQLIGSARHYSGANLSYVMDTSPLWLEVIEQQPHTSILRLTHRFYDANDTVALDPNAFVRVYHDTRQAEVTHCLISTQLKKLFSLDVPLHEVTQTRARMSVFLNKWLRYLLAMGHGPATFDVV